MKFMDSGVSGPRTLLDALKAAEKWHRQVRDTAVAINLETPALPPRIHAEAQRRSAVFNISVAEALGQLERNVLAGRDALDDGPDPAVVAAMKSRPS